MADLLAYSLADLLPFSRATYYRLFALHNEALWPAPIVTLALGFGILGLLGLAPRGHGRAVAALLAGCWLWVAWAFHLERYEPINPAAPYFAAAFALEALLLVWIGVVRGGLRLRTGRGLHAYAGLALVLLALTIEPPVGVLAGRAWPEVALFGLAPDPTVVATLGLLLLAPNRASWVLLPIPVLWCAVNGAIAWTLEAWDGAVAPIAALLVLGIAAQRAIAGLRRAAPTATHTTP